MVWDDASELVNMTIMECVTNLEFGPHPGAVRVSPEFLTETKD